MYSCSYKQRGQKEIINDGYDGFFFNDRQELKDITIRIIRGEVDVEKIRKNAILSCRKFSNSNFGKDLISIVSKILKE